MSDWRLRMSIWTVAVGETAVVRWDATGVVERREWGSLSGSEGVISLVGLVPQRSAQGYYFLAAPYGASCCRRLPPFPNSWADTLTALALNRGTWFPCGANALQGDEAPLAPWGSHPKLTLWSEACCRRAISTASNPIHLHRLQSRYIY